MGDIIGLDVATALEIARELDFDAQAVAMLITYCESGLVEARRKHRENSEDRNG